MTRIETGTLSRLAKAGVLTLGVGAYLRCTPVIVWTCTPGPS